MRAFTDMFDYNDLLIFRAFETAVLLIFLKLMKINFTLPCKIKMKIKFEFEFQR